MSMFTWQSYLRFLLGDRSLCYLGKTTILPGARYGNTSSGKCIRYSHQVILSRVHEHKHFLRGKRAQVHVFLLEGITCSNYLLADHLFTWDIYLNTIIWKYNHILLVIITWEILPDNWSIFYLKIITEILHQVNVSGKLVGFIW